MAFTDIEYEVTGNAAVITLNRPEVLNAFTYHTLNELRSAVAEAAADPEVVGIIVTGAGRGFSSGLDATVLAEVTKAGAGPSETPGDQLPGLFSYLLEVPKPVIAALNGVAAGGGVILALMSDLRFASTDAAVTTVFLKRGLISEHGSSWILPRLVGVGRALDLLWASDKIGAKEALELGLVDKLFEPDRLLPEAIAYIEKLSETVAPLAVAETKRLVYNHLGKGFRDALIEAEQSQNRFVDSDDAREGVASFMEKRPPRFQRVGKTDH